VSWIDRVCIWSLEAMMVQLNEVRAVLMNMGSLNNMAIDSTNVLKSAHA